MNTKVYLVEIEHYDANGNYTSSEIQCAFTSGADAEAFVKSLAEEWSQSGAFTLEGQIDGYARLDSNDLLHYDNIVITVTDTTLFYGRI